jgi:hypothetical protein
VSPSENIIHRLHTMEGVPRRTICVIPRGVAIGLGGSGNRPEQCQAPWKYLGASSPHRKFNQVLRLESHMSFLLASSNSIALTAPFYAFLTSLTRGVAEHWLFRSRELALKEHRFTSPLWNKTKCAQLSISFPSCLETCAYLIPRN